MPDATYRAASAAIVYVLPGPRARLEHGHACGERTDGRRSGGARSPGLDLLVGEDAGPQAASEDAEARAVGGVPVALVGARRRGEQDSERLLAAEG